VLPFKWIISFPVELFLGRLSPVQALEGIGAQIGMAPGGADTSWKGLAGGREELLGGGRMRYLRLLWVFFRVGVMGETAYRDNFFAHLLESVLELASALAGLAVIFSHTTSLGGWKPDELLALVGVYFLMGGVIGLVIQPSMELFTEKVRDGTLDFTLTKPEDSQLLVSIQGVEIWKLTDVALGFAVLVVALVRMGERVGLDQAAIFLAAMRAGGLIVYSFWLFPATSAFWFVRVENILVIFQSVYEAGRWPVSLYPGWLRFALTFLVPVAFATTVPAEALAGRLSRRTLLAAGVFAVALFVVARVFWRIGLRHCSGASS
jgi:ABC-2 type transport system permease protein